LLFFNPEAGSRYLKMQQNENTVGVQLFLSNMPDFQDTPFSSQSTFSSQLHKRYCSDFHKRIRKHSNYFFFKRIKIAENANVKMNDQFPLLSMMLFVPFVASLSSGSCPVHDVVANFDVEKFAGQFFYF
jgi:hypothetical protein